MGPLYAMLPFYTPLPHPLFATIIHFSLLQELCPAYCTHWVASM